MAIKSIVAALSAHPDDLASARAGASLAAAHGAHLIGLHVIETPAVAGFGGVEFPAELYQIQREHYLEAAAEVQQRFEQICSTHGVRGEYRSVEGNAARHIALHARFSDLLCLGRSDSDRARAGGYSLSEDLILSAGKPVLVSPERYPGNSIGEYVTVAWDGSREAARAVHDALSILCVAKRVSVVSIRSGSADAALGQLPGADLGHYLARHGVQVEAQSIHAGSSAVGDALLDWAKGQGSDLIVMGAYGHSRFREVLLGGVTRTMLTDATIPVFMAH